MNLAQREDGLKHTQLELYVAHLEALYQGPHVRVRECDRVAAARPAE